MAGVHAYKCIHDKLGPKLERYTRSHKELVAARQSQLAGSQVIEFTYDSVHTIGIFTK